MNPVTFTVTTTDNSGAGSMRQAAIDANALPVGSAFKIVIGVDGTLLTTFPLPALLTDGKQCWIQGRPSATITGLHCVMKTGGTLTLENVIVENSAYSLAAIEVHAGGSGNKLFLSGSNRIITTDGGITNVSIMGDLIIDKAPGGSDIDSTILTRCVRLRACLAGIPSRLKAAPSERVGAMKGSLQSWCLKAGGSKRRATGAMGSSMWTQ